MYVLSTMDVLFPELVNEIILRLDKPSLFYASQVCKQWRRCCLQLTTEITTVVEFSNACTTGDILSISISKYKDDSFWSYHNFYSLCMKGSLELIKLLISKGTDNWRSGLYGACKGGQMEIAKLLIAKGTEFPLYYDDSDDKAYEDDNLDFTIGLEAACKGHHLDLAYLMIEHGADDWDDNLHFACMGGLRELVDLAIAKGANYWNYGLEGACKGGQLELAELMITKGATDLDHAFHIACEYGRTELVELMIKKGANCLRTSYQYLSDISSDVKPANHHLNVGLKCACHSVCNRLFNSYKNDPNQIFTKTIAKPLGRIMRCLRTVKLMIDKGATECNCGRSIEKHKILCDKYLSAVKHL